MTKVPVSRGRDQGSESGGLGFESGTKSSRDLHIPQLFKNTVKEARKQSLIKMNRKLLELVSNQ